MTLIIRLFIKILKKIQNNCVFKWSNNWGNKDSRKSKYNTSRNNFQNEKNSNLIFKNKVLAKGTKDKKIKFVNFNQNNNDKWGTIALVGPNSSGSQFKNTEFDGGTGTRSKQFSFTSMLSVHNTQNIIIENSSFTNNSLYDDITFSLLRWRIIKNLSFNNAFGDAIDIDISKYKGNRLILIIQQMMQLI